MSVLGDLRRELADDAAGSPVELTTYDHVPARVQLPAAFVIPGQPYVEAGQTFGSSTVRFGLVLLTHPSPNSDETDQLDERIESVQRRLTDAGWLVERVEQPEVQELSGGAEVLATVLRVAAGGVTFP